MVDLGKSRKALVTSYTLRHGGNYKADSLRTWDFQGSNDAQTWVVLRRHAADKSLNANFASTTWSCTADKETNRPFRYFRIIQTARNSNNHNFLVVGGLELYGHLFSGAPAPTPKRWDEGTGN